MDFHEVGRTLLEGLHEETLGILEFHEACKNFLEMLHEVLLVVVLYEVGTLYIYYFVFAFYSYQQCIVDQVFPFFFSSCKCYHTEMIPWTVPAFL